MIIDDIMFEHDPNEMLEEEKHQDIDDLAVADSNSENNNEVNAKEGFLTGAESDEEGDEAQLHILVDKSKLEDDRMEVKDEPSGELGCASTAAPTFLGSPPGWLPPLPPPQHKYTPK